MSDETATVITTDADFGNRLLREENEKLKAKLQAATNRWEYYQGRCHTSEDEIERLRAELAAARVAVAASIVALDDWLHLYIPEEFDDGTLYGWRQDGWQNYVAETHKRIRKAGGTLAYIADVQERNRRVLTRPVRARRTPVRCRMTDQQAEGEG